MLISDYNKKFFSAFVRRCEACNLRPASIVQYGKVLKRFLRVYEADNCTAGDVRCYLSKLDVAPATRRIHYMSLSVFFGFLFKNNMITNNPMVGVEKPKVPKKQMRFFSNEEIRQLLNCWDESTFTGCRNKTMMLVFFATGLRRAELAQLTTDDLRWDLDCLLVHGKGGLERSVPLTTELRRVLVNYLTKRQKALKRATKALFINSNTGEQLTPAGVWSVFKQSPVTGERVSCHTWRHTFARHFLLYGNGDLVSLQAILGHADIATTKKYLWLASEDVALVNNKANPLVTKKYLL